MYIPEQFEEARVEILHELIGAHPLATLVAFAEGRLTANHIPMLVEPEGAFGVLRGHVARANPLWREFSPEVEVLAVFQGPQAYVTPSWYPTKRETGKVVPTWNYAVVHASGPLRVIDDRAWLRRFVEQLTNRHEAPRSAPWKVTDAPADFIDTMTSAIVGIEVPIVQLTGKWKVSQNRPQKDRTGVAAGLMQITNDAAASMAQLVQQKKGD